MARAEENADLSSRAAMIQTSMAVCITQNNVDGLYKVQQQIAELERYLLPNRKYPDRYLETVSQLYLRLFRTTRRVVLPADRYDDYVIKSKGTTY
jgi:hypothetical protein